jgi:hypothetical protein
LPSSDRTASLERLGDRLELGGLGRALGAADQLVGAEYKQGVQAVGLGRRCDPNPSQLPKNLAIRR